MRWGMFDFCSGAFKAMVSRACLMAGLTAITFRALAAPDAQLILEHSDHARGGGLPGIVWEIHLASSEGDKVAEEQRLRVKAVSDASVAETLEPARFRASKLLQVGRNMWLSKPGLSKPIPISSRQRMSGQAANGDIAATNYAADYEAVLMGEEGVNGVPCYLLELRARHKRATYDRVRYWVSIENETAVKAEFFALSGKLLKSALFAYKNLIEYEGHRIPFVSRMTISDALSDSETVMEFGKVEVRRIAPAEFDLGQLQ